MEPLLGFWLFMMGSIVSGLGISLWLALRQTRSTWKQPEMFSYICACGYKVSLPENDEVIDQLLAVADMHERVSHGKGQEGPEAGPVSHSG